MDQVKIDNFERENPTKAFPKYVTVKSESCDKIRSTLYGNLKLDVSINNLVLVNEIEKRGEICEGINSENKDFDLRKVLSCLNINIPEHVFINWYRYDNLDEIQFSDLTKHFDDIWYPDVDDIDIFDDTFGWVLSITHYGQLKVLKF